MFNNKISLHKVYKPGNTELSLTALYRKESAWANKLERKPGSERKAKISDKLVAFILSVLSWNKIHFREMNYQKHY